MTLMEWAGVISGLVIVAGVVGLAWATLRSGQLQWEQSCRLVCPRFGSLVGCRMVQDVRTGQWKDVQSCTAFQSGEDIACDLECARLMNLGHRLRSFAWFGVRAHAPEAGPRA